MQIEFAAFSELGPRATNEDRYLEPLERGEALLIAIADGMGGAAGGEQAAALAIDAVRALEDIPAKLDAAFQNTVDAIRKSVSLDDAVKRMGTTLSAAAIVNGDVHVAHVGDTRIYHLRDRGLKSLTQDQTEIAELVRRGVFTENEARKYPRRNVLISALTANADFTIFHSQAKLKPGDRLLFLSDGVHQKVRRGAIVNASIAHEDVHDFAADIRSRVIDAKPSDNFTAIALEIVAL